ncbi:hypothetical protein DYI37_03165 [Fulvimarina endophytica]|uniref:Uncharacterized protein n=1 Tax=Fulvimarina endophytica TaxID=2293836 RepID=A0A371XB48_9HYPH|nr:phage minor head protein [Fulvimarina endophytica]RFC66457.1 hypothetical protein DYI37_03165 [Fulvimarina endophytica]
MTFPWRPAGFYSAIRKADVADDGDDDRKRLEDLGKRLEARFRRAFIEYVQRITDEATIKAMVDLISQGRVNEAIGYLDQFADRFGEDFAEAFREAAKEEMAAQAPRAVAAMEASPYVPNPVRVEVTFGGGNPRAAEAARTEGARLVQEISEPTREVVQQVVSNGLSQGAGPREFARELRSSLGLTDKQNAAVANYERLLRAGSKEALTRELRDKRSDGPVLRAAEGGKPLTEDQIGRMVEAYRRKYLKYRTENIARTEALQAASLGRIEGMRQTLESLDLTTNDVEKTWSTSVDGRERRTHRLMNGQKVKGLDAQFQSPGGARLRFPRDPAGPADEVVMCRCAFTFRITIGE